MVNLLINVVSGIMILSVFLLITIFDYKNNKKK